MGESHPSPQDISHSPLPVTVPAAIVNYEASHTVLICIAVPCCSKPTKIRMGVDDDGKAVRLSRRTGTPIPKPEYADSEAGRKAAEFKNKYEDKFCDTSAVEAARVTYHPSALSFEEEVIASLNGLEIDWSRLADIRLDEPVPEPHA